MGQEVVSTDEARGWARCLDNRLLDESGCWISLYRLSPAGYAATRIGSRKGTRKTVMVHRLSLAISLGVTLEEMGRWCDDAGVPLVVDHLCRVRSCFNPDHLDLVTQQTNVLRGVAPAADQSRQTHCLHGHLLTGANLMPSPSASGRRQCLTCSRVRGFIGRRRRSGRLVPSWADAEARSFSLDANMAAAAKGWAA